LQTPKHLKGDELPRNGSRFMASMLNLLLCETRTQISQCAESKAETCRELRGGSWKWQQQHPEVLTHDPVVPEMFLMKSRQSECRPWLGKLPYLLSSLAESSVFTHN